jgi:hypothetical protein
MIPSLLQLFAVNTGCKLQGGGFFGFPHWYKYLDGIQDVNGVCTPHLNGINDIWLVVAAVIEILLRVAVILSFIMVIYGGVNYITSQGEPDKTSQAKNTIVNALLGLAIAVLAASIVAFIAGRIG